MSGKNNELLQEPIQGRILWLSQRRNEQSAPITLNPMDINLIENTAGVPMEDTSNGTKEAPELPLVTIGSPDEGGPDELRSRGATELQSSLELDEEELELRAQIAVYMQEARQRRI
jgi:hypothetical protein